MADVVNLSLENAVREAEILENSGTFAHVEVKYILQKRSRFEYLLRRQKAAASRFLNYIKFESDVLKLHKLRSPASNNSRSNIVSHALIRKIHTLYQRMLRIYRGNVGLWLDFTTFCYSHGSQRLLSEVISQALQLNPTCAGLWSFAARWEYKRKGDIAAARHLLLRGLRNCNQSKVLWQVYFRLELMYGDALRARRQVLLGNEQVEEKGQDQGAVAEIVFCGAVRSHSGDITFHLQLLSMAAEYQVNFSLLNISFASSDTPAFVTF